MKKRNVWLICLSVVLIVACMTLFAGCGGKQEAAEYTIQYADDVGAHTITVTYGMPYSLDVIPEKAGHEFVGLFDEEIGGEQYVASNGASLSTYRFKKNIVLFPQYKAKEYTVILDYQGASISGDRKLAVLYGSDIPGLPQNLVCEHKKFIGWYTAPDCGGTQIADVYGPIPIVSVLNEQNFDISGSSITLYAGFELEKYTVTLNFEAGMEPEVVQVVYDTPINKMFPKTRVNGNAVLTWSKTQDGEAFNGKITSDMVLYAVEYAPIIEFDSVGGEEVMPIVARAGSTIELPTATKDMAKFSYWEDMNGDRYDSTTMPSKSTMLKAVWQAKLVFDENGGSEVDDISEKAGTSIKLPMPEREGYVFAGWYTEGKDLYSSTTMPAYGIKLKAGWYKEKSTIINFISGTKEVRMNPNSQYTLFGDLTIDLSGILENDFTGFVDITANFEWYNNKATVGYQAAISFNLYSKDIVSDVYLMDTFEFSNSGKYTQYSFSGKYFIESNKIFVGAKRIRSSTYSNGYLRDYYVSVKYADTTDLHL